MIVVCVGLASGITCLCLFPLCIRTTRGVLCRVVIGRFISLSMCRLAVQTSLTVVWPWVWLVGAVLNRFVVLSRWATLLRSRAWGRCGSWLGFVTWTVGLLLC